MQEWLIQLVNQHTFWVYAVVVVLACAEGPILSMIFGVLLRLQVVSLLPIYAVLMVGDLIGDTFWYYIGRKFGHSFVGRFGKYFSITEESVAKVTNIFHKYKHYILFISKISNGLGFSLVTLMVAGMVKIPFLRYLFVNATGQFIWTGLLLTVGYFFGNAYIAINNIFGKIALIALFIVLILAFNGYRKYLRTHIEQAVE
jgi:membrane-associated protein